VSAIAQTNPPPMHIPGTIDQTAQNDVKLAVMEKELEVSKDFTQHILATVYFCIGTTIVVLFAMVGFGWFQNIRAYKRDKEALRQALTATLNEHIAQKIQEVDKKANERFGVFDGKMADALEKTFQQLFELHISLESSIFRVAHIAKTPRTDFMEFLNHAQRAIGKVSPRVLDDALSVVQDYLEKVERMNSSERTELLKFINLLPPENVAHVERIREVLAEKPD
jgi:hypothetical protein